jgi:hypothetical protein
MIYDKIGPIIPPLLKILHLPRCAKTPDSRGRSENDFETIE